MAMEPSGPPEPRLTEAQREAAIDALRTAVGAGRINLDEFGDRAALVYGTEHLHEIRAVLADVAPPEVIARLTDTRSTPSTTHGDAGALAPPPPTGAQYVVAVMSGAERKGAWTASAQVNALAVMGGCKLDFRHAELSAPVTHVNAIAIMGGIDVVVPEGVPVDVEGFVLMGGVDDKTRGGREPGAPLLRVRAYGLWGGVTVRHPRSRDRRRDRAAETGSSPLPRPAASSFNGGTVTLMFTDLIESTSMAQSLGDHRWYEVLQQHNQLLREEFERCGGEEVKGQGDGFMVSFASARRALVCAVNIQRSLLDHRRTNPETDLHVRIGLHSGDVISEDGDLFGRNVILASRIAAAAGPDEILASALTKQLAESGGELYFDDGRMVELRGLSGPWRVHAVRWS
jgi:class 3 adenylate cyclase